MISLLLASAFTSLNPLDIALDVRRTRAEIPGLENWAQIDENGKKRIYHDGGSYFRWLPCVTRGAIVEIE